MLDRESKRSATVIDELEKEKGGRLVEREDCIHVEIGGKDSWVLRAYGTPRTLARTQTHTCTREASACFAAAQTFMTRLLSEIKHDIALTKPLTAEERVQS